jgi:NitT/TauT family transport system ATP-binding protein
MPNASDLNNLIEFAGVGKTYLNEPAQAIHDVTFSVSKGSFTCFIGPSGCGKSTVLKLIAGLEKPSTGKITVPQSDDIGMVFQSGALFPWLSARDNISLILGARGASKTKARQQADEFLKLVNLESFAEKYPADLSGGQRQRVGIARALAVQPQVLLLDEPFSALDPKTTAELHEDLLRLWKHTGTTVVMVSHLIEEAVSLAQHIILMKTGTIAERYSINIPYPRREQETDFIHQVHAIRRAFFA